MNQGKRGAPRVARWLVGVLAFSGAAGLAAAAATDQVTAQEDRIAELERTVAILADELHHPNIGYTTVYRTMKLLCDAGLATERHFDGGVTRYEIEHEHHDHLVCLRCGKIIEFECAMIEKTQQEIADRYRFRVLRHRHELYGHCDTCAQELAE